MTFRISDKVVCVDDSPAPERPGRNPHTLKKGTVYTVCEVLPDIAIPSGIHLGGFGVNVTGQKLGSHPTGIPYGFKASRFRKLTDIQAENAAKREELIPCGKEARRE